MALFKYEQSLKERVQIFTIKFIICALALVEFLFPTWIYCSFQYILSPQDFWQSLALLGVAVWLLGALQIGLLIVWLTIAIYVWVEL